MISLAVAWVYVTAIHAGMEGMQPIIFVMTGMLDVAMVWGLATAIRGWPSDEVRMDHRAEK